MSQFSFGYLGDFNGAPRRLILLCWGNTRAQPANWMSRTGPIIQCNIWRVWRTGGIRALFWSPGTDWDTILAQAAAIPNGADGVTMNTQLLAFSTRWLVGVMRSPQRQPIFTAQPRRTHGTLQEMPGAGGDRAI